ncbi:MAG: preprotein translocase subunit TatC [Candidatus Taylorbacteria bacterium]|nr:preprotein translocase subunit TatC [Candidatus Taylorbacteria bacterium]
MEEFKKNIEKYLPFLEDLRSRLYIGVVLFVTFFFGGFLSARMILKTFLNFVHIDQVVIATSSPFQFVEVAMDVGFFIAIMVSVPYIIYSFYIFIVPALTRKERVRVLRSIPLSIGLFAVGFFYGFFILYYSLETLASINVGLGIANFWNISQFLSQMLITSALLGLVFEFPLLLSLLIKLGVITPQTLKSNRRIAYFLLFAMASLLPPTDGISLVAMTLPLVLLYEMTILLNNKGNYAWTRT